MRQDSKRWNWKDGVGELENKTGKKPEEAQREAEKNQKHANTFQQKDMGRPARNFETKWGQYLEM